MISSLLPLLQICDSNFPSGAFSHSFGLETYIQEWTIEDRESFQAAIEQYVYSQCTYTDGLAFRLSFEAMEEGKPEKLWRLDQELFALANAKETREGNRRVGRQLAKVMNELYKFNLLQEYETGVKSKKRHGHSAIVYAIVCRELGASLKEALTIYLFASASSLVQNGVRGIPLGQTDGQKLLRDLQPLLHSQAEIILSLSEEDFGGSAPGLEIAQMIHEDLPVRLFMS